MNIGVYEEQPMEISLKPRIRTYREKSRRSAIRESAEQKQETRRKMLEKQREEMEKLQALEVNGRIHFGELPVLEPRIREILLKWLSDAMESADVYKRQQMHHIFPASDYPAIADYLENLIALTPTQHYTCLLYTSGNQLPGVETDHDYFPEL